MRWREPLRVTLCALLSAAVLTGRSQAEGSWSTEFVGNGLWSGGSLGWGWAVAWYDDRLFVGGGFDRAGGQVANGIAAWNGTAWSPLGSGVWDAFNNDPGTVQAFLAHDGQLFVGGSFTHAGGVQAQNLAKWYPPDHWLAAGNINGTVTCMTEYNGDLIVGGGFDHVDWDGEWLYTGNVAGLGPSGWYPIAGYGGSNNVIDLAVWDGQLVAGGAFHGMQGNYDLDYLARWDGSTWSSFSASGNDEIDGMVKAIAVFQGELYIGGSFWTIGGKPVEKMARWDGVEWQPVGEEVWSALIYGYGPISFAVYNGALFVGGGFRLGAPWWTDGIMRWDGASWSVCGAGLNNSVIDLERIDDGVSEKLYAAGAFSLADGYIDSRGIAAWIETPVTAVAEAGVPRGITLHPSSPNPFNAQTRVAFTLEEETWLKVDLLDVLGRLVATLTEGLHGPGEQTLDWQGRDNRGNELPSGIYLLRLSSPAGAQLQKLVLAK